MHLIRPDPDASAPSRRASQLRHDPAPTQSLESSRRLVHAGGVWSSYRDDDPSHPPHDPEQDPTPGVAPQMKPGLDPLELVVNGETFVVSRRPGPAGTFDFDWISHPQSYGFALSSYPGWKPDRAELITRIRDFLAEIDPETGYLAD